MAGFVLAFCIKYYTGLLWPHRILTRAGAGIHEHRSTATGCPELREVNTLVIRTIVKFSHVV